MLRAKRVVRSMFTKDWQGLLAILVIIMFLAVVVTAVTSPSPQSQMLAYDNDWDDLSKFRGDILNMPLNLSVRTVGSSAASLADITDARGMLYVAIGVERPYSFAEWRAIRLFQTRGGTVIVADDYGHGNSLLRYNGYVDNPAISHVSDTAQVQYVFSGERLSDVRVDRNPQLVRLTVPIWPGLEYEVLLNDPSCFVLNDKWGDLEPWEIDYQAAAPAVIIANSSSYSWLDEDRDGIRDPGEKVDEYPVVINQQGMVLISDPSIFINDMYDRMDNRWFAQALIVKMVPAGGVVIFDESIHLETGVLSEVDDAILRPLYRVFGESWPLYSFFLVLVIGIGGMIAVSRRPIVRYEPHRNRFDEPRTLEFGHPYNWLADYYEVRGVLLQRMRYAYGLDPDELQRLPPDIVSQLLGDQYLVQFVLQPVRVDPMALQAALGDITAWEPPVHAELLVRRAENYLASLPPGAPVAWTARPAQPPGSGPPGGGPR